MTRDLISAVMGLFGDVRNQSRECATTAPVYFKSFETCYPLLSEAGELLREAAVRMGIDTQGKTKLEIAKEVFLRQPKG